MLVVCNGGRRSGSTLQFNLTRALLELTGNGEGGDFFTEGQLTDADVDRMMQREDWIVIKAHHVEPALIRAATDSSKCLILFTYRDLRDVAASIQRFVKSSWADTLAILGQSVVLNNALEGHPRSHAQCYEDLILQTRVAIEEIAKWLAIPLTDTLIDDVLEAASIESAHKAIGSIPLRQRAWARTQMMWRGVPQPLRHRLWETRLGSRVFERIVRYANVVEPTTHLHPGHISPSFGRPGAWRESLTESQVSNIESRFGEWLSAHDYELSAI